jgi:hypothetical protein
MHQSYKAFYDPSTEAKTLAGTQRGWASVGGLAVCGSRRYRIGGAKRDRTADPLRARQVLSQLSYSPIVQMTEDRGLMTDNS